MRLFSRIFSVILVLFVLSILYLPSVKAGCSFDAYGNCTGTCSCSPYCGSCNCKAFSTSFCIEDKSTCYPCPTNTPRPTNTPTPKPTNTPASQNCNWIGYNCVGSCAAGYSCKAVGSYTCACVANTPQPTRPGASPTVTPPGCWCQNGKCVGNLTFCRYIAVCPTGLSQMKLKSRHFENYPISGNQKP
jgi:hypothetical protein